LSLVEYDGDRFTSVTLGTANIRCKILHKHQSWSGFSGDKEIIKKIDRYITD